ncbi:hypothetical protein RF11_03884 [Thelohanellus kitauei]|uniref:CCHC-type domain-containing protein n=1 Tax=Thelohanellus kitauei TaxID=669202 RepID=A0A0C2MBU1_THEKT|nr:hypothetical protein RF11_03884 [Thelohanellus kitauei]
MPAPAAPQMHSVVSTNMDATRRPLSLEEIDKIAYLEDTEDCSIDQLVDLQIRINEITVKAESTIYSSNQESASNYGEQNHLRVKLPKLNINNFSGNINKWTNIWALFEGNIYSNPMFNNKEKFAYLLGFIPNDENYTKVLDILQCEYGDSTKLIEYYYDKIIQIRTLTQESEFLFNFIDIENYIKILESVGENSNQPLLLHIIKRKIPKCILINLHENGLPHTFNLDQLRHRISEYIKLRKDSLSRTKFEIPRYQNSETHSNKYERSCAFCSGGHFSDQCSKFKTVIERLQILGNGCHSCLNKGHSKRDCKRIKPCFHCKKLHDHHPSFCQNKSKYEQPNNLSIGPSLLSHG